MKPRIVVLATAVLFALAAATSGAQTSPTPAPAPTPSIQTPQLPPTNQIINDVINAVLGRATGAYGYNANQVDGTVTYFRRFDMQVQLQLDKYRQVHLHQGTIINPRGWSIQSGQNVDVYGHTNSDGSFEADSITVHG
ncbi:MAG TPA: hypothetical protein VMS32_09080 [Verrucomicrobiae bacterium]|jgi:hypothetical protein|nr:hypothetical protein [Verrucomicrobiae bacterium]